MEKGFVPLGSSAQNPHTGGKWWRPCIQTHTDNTLSSSKTIRFLRVGASGSSNTPTYDISGRTHATAGRDPNAYQIITFQPMTPAQLSHLLLFLFIAFPRDFVLYMLNSAETSQSSFSELKCPQKGDHLPQAEYCTQKLL